jgi:hypothetical protein
VSPEEERGSADAKRAGAAGADAGRPVEEGVDLLEADLDRHELGATLDDELRAESVPLVHLEREPSEVAKPFLAQAQERLPLALELSRWRDDVLRPRGGCVR